MKRYQLLERLSSGHACDTYDAWSHERGFRVIVRTGDVRREGRLLERLTHPNIVRVYEVHRDWIVLETLGGATLAALPSLSHEDAVEMGRQLCSAIGYLHRKGWLHLDLKPDNLIADGGRLKVIDFSIAQRPGRVEPGTGTRRWIGAGAAARRHRHHRHGRVGDRGRAARGRPALRGAGAPRGPPVRRRRASMAGCEPTEPESGVSVTACA
jgi:serine/threonine protein kinase